ncbi:MAG: DUF4010 domain-containing protein [Phycisphaerales bacterium]|jgi:uncharacterized membrane protein (DUF4010 family)|nr:DUF4010 domain-containing protein [Phycisphaerales bacterium]
MGICPGLGWIGLAQSLWSAHTFEPHDVALKIALSTGIGLLVGLEREWAQKEIGVRTFAIVGLLGTLTYILAPIFVVGGLLGVLLLVAFLNTHSLLQDRSLELTTSISLVVVFFLGALVGDGKVGGWQTFAASSAAIVMMMLLAWKLELERFAGALRPDEIRSAVLLGLLSVVIYPLLPNRFVDKTELLNPRQAWKIVVVIAGLGFVNYTLLRIYAAKGLFLSALLGGLVNSTAAVVELAACFTGQPGLLPVAVPVLLLTNVALFVRNGLILAIFAPAAVKSALFPLAVMAVATLIYIWAHRKQKQVDGSLNLPSPISLKRVLKFAALFVLLAALGTLAQQYFGNSGFLVLSVIGGLVSSASTTATAAALVASGKISPQMGGVATVITSMASAVIDIPLVYQQIRPKSVVWKLTAMTAVITLLGVAAMIWENLHLIYR